MLQPVNHSFGYPIRYILKQALRNIHNLTDNHTSNPTASATLNPKLSDARQTEQRIMKVAILGTPNAGKSTLINKLIGHPVFAVSTKVHTTRSKARAAVVRGKTQVLFVDTPGLVSASEVKRHHLEKTFEEGGIQATKEADIVGIVHDAANQWTSGYIDDKILNILHQIEPSKKTFLVLNKTDAVKVKKSLLEMIRSLTETGESSADRNHRSKKRSPWPHFSEVFLVSALSGDGVKDILDYLVKEAGEGKWRLPAGILTDQNPNIIISELVRGRLMDALPEEVPYNIKIETEYLHQNELGEYICVVLVICYLPRHRKMLLAGNGRIVKEIATLAESDARDALRQQVRLRLVVTVERKPISSM